MKIKIRKKDVVNRLRPGGFYPFLKVTDKDEGTRDKAKAVFHELQKDEEVTVDFNGKNEETFFALYPEFELVGGELVSKVSKQAMKKELKELYEYFEEFDYEDEWEEGKREEKIERMKRLSEELKVSFEEPISKQKIEEASLSVSLENANTEENESIEEDNENEGSDV